MRAAADHGTTGQVAESGESDALKAIVRRIRADGPISVASYMQHALSHPEHGYYARRDPLGRDGDFTTAPEISQIFGELIGLALAEVWRLAGAPNPVRLVEMGPGRGSLLADLLRAGTMQPGFLEGLSLHLVEIDASLAAMQRARLKNAPCPVFWHRDFAAIPDDRPLIILANEFFDALPIHQLIRTDKGWRERMVGLSHTPDAAGTMHENAQLAFMLADTPADRQLRDNLPGDSLPLECVPIGSCVEQAAAAWSLARQMGRRLRRHGGAALIIDYGYMVEEGRVAVGDTLQALRRHAPCHPLSAPGESDLTAHVDFTRLAGSFAADGGITTWLANQGDFLRALGAEMRAERLATGKSEAQAEDIRAGLRRLIHDDAMGRLFRVLGVTAGGWPMIPGLNLGGDPA